MKKILLIIPLLLLTLLLSTTETKAFITYTYPSLNLTEDYNLTIVWDEVAEQYIYPEHLFNDFSNIKTSPDLHHSYYDYALFNDEKYLFFIFYSGTDSIDELIFKIYHDIESYHDGDYYRQVNLTKFKNNNGGTHGDESIYKDLFILDYNWNDIIGESFEITVLKPEPELTYQDGYDKGYIDGKNDANQNNPGGTIAEDESWLESNWYYIPIALAGLFILKVMFFSEDTKGKSTRKKKR